MKIAILDKDGTLIKPKSGNSFVQNPEDQVLIPGVADALTKLKSAGFVLAIASNQGGVAAGKKSFYSALDEMIFAMKLTGIELAMFAHSYENDGYGEAVFIDRQDGGQQWKPITSSRVKFRKPEKGMIDYLSARIYGDRLYDKDAVLMVGDREEDKGAAKSAEVRFVWADKLLSDSLLV